MIVSLKGCVNYLLLLSKLPHKLVAKIANIIFILSMSEEFGRALAECFWLKIFYEVAVRVLISRL